MPIFIKVLPIYRRMRHKTLVVRSTDLSVKTMKTHYDMLKNEVITGA